jgi:hypothetical protein
MKRCSIESVIHRVSVIHFNKQKITAMGEKKMCLNSLVGLELMLGNKMGKRRFRSGSKFTAIVKLN